MIKIRLIRVVSENVANVVVLKEENGLNLSVYRIHFRNYGRNVVPFSITHVTFSFKGNNIYIIISETFVVFYVSSVRKEDNNRLDRHIVLSNFIP